MKKTISLLLCLLLTFGCALPAAAMDYSNPSRAVPVILIGGDGDPLYDKDGNKVLEATKLGELFNGKDSGELYRSVAEVLQPFLLEGVLFNRWDRYYENLEREVGELTEPFRLDENGNASNGTTISQAHINETERNKHLDKKGKKGYYSIQDYHFWYDWRLDPLEIADQLEDYIDGILEATGAERVAIASRCVGTSVAAAYVAKYGTGKLYGLGIDGTCTNGGEFLSDALSGKFKVDANAIDRYLLDSKTVGMFDISEFALASVDLLAKSGALDAVVGVTRATVYKKIMEGATSAIALSTVFTMPCYWAFVTAEDYPTAIRYVFGEPGSEKRQTYAGLIEKLDNYHRLVRRPLHRLMRSLPENDVRVAIISKYGFQIVPICESCNAVSDQYASVHRSSFGATTSTIYNTLSEEYVASREAQGLGRYISPDRQVDASTCLLPDCTWFVKGVRHGNWLDAENQILYSVITAERQLTPADLPYTQFFVYDDETETVSPMTEENCGTEYWPEDLNPEPAGPFTRLQRFLSALKTWLRLFTELIKTKLQA